jgi:hypothetical protein
VSPCAIADRWPYRHAAPYHPLLPTIEAKARLVCTGATRSTNQKDQNNASKVIRPTAFQPPFHSFSFQLHIILLQGYVLPHHHYKNENFHHTLHPPGPVPTGTLRVHTCPNHVIKLPAGFGTVFKITSHSLAPF